MFQANLPIKFWGEVVLAAAYLINRTPTAIHQGRSPYEILHGVKPNYNQLRVFGSACYVHCLTRDKDKFSKRSRLCVFVGYPFGKKGWKVYDIERNEFLVSRDVVFREDVFPFAEPKLVPRVSLTTPIDCDEDWVITPIVRGSTKQTSMAPNPQSSPPPIVEPVSSPVSAPAQPDTELIVSPTST